MQVPNPIFICIFFSEIQITFRHILIVKLYCINKYNDEHEHYVWFLYCSIMIICRELLLNSIKNRKDFDHRQLQILEQFLKEWNFPKIKNNEKNKFRKSKDPPKKIKMLRNETSHSTLYNHQQFKGSFKTRSSTSH